MRQKRNAATLIYLPWSPLHTVCLLRNLFQLSPRRPSLTFQQAIIPLMHRPILSHARLPHSTILFDPLASPTPLIAMIPFLDNPYGRYRMSSKGFLDPTKGKKT